MSATAVDYDLADLLQRAGAQIRGRNRADCPRCGGRRTVSFTDELFCCHHAGCDFRGNAFTLTRELGLARRLSPAEARALRLERDRAEAAARAFLVRVRGARFGLGGLHIELLNLRDEAHERLKVNHDDETAWETLAYVYSEFPRVRAELALLGDGRFEDREAWLKADNEKRREMAGRILQVGGVPTFDGTWTEVGDAAPSCPPKPTRCGTEKKYYGGWGDAACPAWNSSLPSVLVGSAESTLSPDMCTRQTQSRCLTSAPCITLKE